MTITLIGGIHDADMARVLGYAIVDCTSWPDYPVKRGTKDYESVKRSIVMKAGEICKKKRGQYPLMVHCMAGVNRSVACYIAHLVIHTKMKLGQACKYVKNKRGVANAGDQNSFWNILLEIACEAGKPPLRAKSFDEENWLKSLHFPK